MGENHSELCSNMFEFFFTLTVILSLQVGPTTGCHSDNGEAVCALCNRSPASIKSYLGRPRLNPSQVPEREDEDDLTLKI